MPEERENYSHQIKIHYTIKKKRLVPLNYRCSREEGCLERMNTSFLNCRVASERGESRYEGSRIENGRVDYLTGYEDWSISRNSLDRG